MGGFALIPQVVDIVKLPVIAVGGIADGRGLAAAFALGAEGVQIGPRFSRAQLLAQAKRTEALFHRSRQTERTLRTPSRDAWREESGTG